MSAGASWTEVRLGDITEFKYGKSLPAKKRTGSGFPVFGSNGEVGRHSDAVTAGTTIIVGRKGSFGEVTWSDDPCWPIDTTYYVDASTTKADLRWLYYRLQALPLKDLNRAAAVPGLNREDAYNLTVLLPPIEEQRRIASVLDAADELRAKRRDALDKLDTLTQAIFIDMFGSGGWPTSRLGDEVETTSGGTPSRRKPEFFEGDIPWVKSGEVAKGVVRATEEHISAEAVASSSAKLMPPGTVLLAMYGATVGAVGELGIEATTNQAVCCITPSATMSRTYLIGLLRSLKRELVAKGAGGAQPNISQTIIRDLRVPVPPVDAQAAYAARVRAVTAATERAREAESALDALSASLQQRAFRGEL